MSGVMVMPAKANALSLESAALECGPGVIVESSRAQKYWQRRREPSDVEWLILDEVDSNVNRINEGMLTSLEKLLDDIEESKPKALVIRSGKANGFLAGADISQFVGITDPAKARIGLERAHSVVDRIAALPFPTIAVVHGFCLGGGLELALACKHRIAVAGASFGFPEILLGLHPGMGGIARATALIDPVEAMTMMLTGKNKYGPQAKRAGLADILTEERHVVSAVHSLIEQADKPRPEPKFSPIAIRQALFNFPFVRGLIAKRMRNEASERARPEHYPAPFALIDLWEEHAGDFAKLNEAEIDSFSKLVVGEMAQNLIRVFFLREKLKEKGQTTADIPTISHVHVVGAGAMGADIAAWCALQGHTVTLADKSLDALGNAMKRAHDLYEHAAHTSMARRDALDRLMPDPKGAGVIKADLVIEAIPEKLDLKHVVHVGLEARMKESAILATNTSSIRLEDLRSNLRRPERLVGIHFFNPVPRMQLVEIVAHDGASSDVLEAARAFTIGIDRLPVMVKSAAGFLVNRALMPYLMEALILLDEGVAAETIDAAAEYFGMPMGPLRLADEVGLDICVDVAKVLKANLPTPFPDIPAWLERKVAQGETGKKAGKGIYTYKNGVRQTDVASTGKAVASPQGTKNSKASDKQSDKAPLSPDPEMTDRLILSLVNTVATCLREGVVKSEDEADGALAFGAGFAPFRGGPMQYAKTRGQAAIRAALEGLSQKYGTRFKPDPYWQK